MKKWEYLLVSGNDNYLIVNGVKRQRPQPPGHEEFLELLNDLGEQGWELTTQQLHREPSEAVLAFKRPKEESSETGLDLSSLQNVLDKGKEEINKAISQLKSKSKPASSSKPIDAVTYPDDTSDQPS